MKVQIRIHVKSTKNFIHDMSTWSSLSSAKLLVPDAAAVQHIRTTVHCNSVINIEHPPGTTVNIDFQILATCSTLAVHLVESITSFIL